MKEFRVHACFSLSDEPTQSHVLCLVLVNCASGILGLMSIRGSNLFIELARCHVGSLGGLIRPNKMVVFINTVCFESDHRLIT